MTILYTQNTVGLFISETPADVNIARIINLIECVIQTQDSQINTEHGCFTVFCLNITLSVTECHTSSEKIHQRIQRQKCSNDHEIFGL